MFTTPEHLINRLTGRNMHLLALRLSAFLRISPDPVLKHWAVAKIKRSKASATGAAAEEDDQATCSLIVEKFKEAGDAGRGVSFADIAKKAWENGRTRLATMVQKGHMPPSAWSLTKHLPQSAFRSRTTSCRSGSALTRDERGHLGSDKGGGQRRHGPRYVLSLLSLLQRI